MNDVRSLVGAKDLKSFYESLKGGKLKGFPSYPAACTYHAKPWRDPPTVYLARIAEIFPQINLAWLVSGNGEPLQAAEYARLRAEPSPGEERLQQAFERGLHLKVSVWDRSFRSMMETVGKLRVAATLDGQLSQGLTLRESEEVDALLAERIGRAAHLSMDALGLLSQVQQRRELWVNGVRMNPEREGERVIHGISAGQIDDFIIRFCIAIESAADADAWMSSVEDQLKGEARHGEEA